ncbi:MAG: cobalamin synthesis protein P47K [Tannerellaceae bacterium]|jgi:Ni2+-binding GTPase involved in maturation of urease and hydrogenase|nr:cobalamin synthesis protein P47K [Tannerellaceae bacterium]
MKTKIILAGGFLGSGKTTLLLKAAQMLGERGLRTGVITNDQAPELTDSLLLRHEGLRVEEVSGSCFCCNYKAFAEAAQSLRRDSGAEIILAEPVGSCTDLSATVVQPLKAYGAEDFAVAPLSVLVEPLRLAITLSSGATDFHEDAVYICRKQLEEADIIVITHADKWDEQAQENVRRTVAENFPLASIHIVSSITGQGMDGWLDEVMSDKPSGRQIASVDYNRYAKGEAGLSWFNGTFFLHGEGVDWNQVAAELMKLLEDACDERNFAVGHVKLILENCEQYVMGNMTAMSSEILMRGSVDRVPDVRLTLNVRLECNPLFLEKTVQKSLGLVSKDKFVVETVAWRCFSPSRPEPTYRFTEIV